MSAWLRGTDSNRRPSGYEPDELPLLHPAAAHASDRLHIGQTSGDAQELWMCVFNDPDGNVLALMSEVPIG